MRTESIPTVIKPSEKELRLPSLDLTLLMNLANMGVLVWMAKRQIGRIDALTKLVRNVRERVSRIEGRLQ